MKDYSRIELIKRLMKDNVIKADTINGGLATFIHHFNQGRVPLRSIQLSDKKKIYVFNDSEYQTIKKQLLQYLR